MSNKFLPFDYPICFGLPRYLTDIRSWHEHIPFAFFCIAMLRPRVFVELGTHKGDSYCAFCQAVDELALETKCYAVDHWHGDEHAGFYEIEVLEQLQAYHEPLYSRFSQLIRSTFDEARDLFDNKSIDLLHIDGLHTYEAVKHDFQNWQSALSDRGVVLFHDTQVREDEFGVWKLWEELAGSFPSFEFKYGHGLGVLAVGEEIEPAFQNFLDAANKDPNTVSGFFHALGNRIALRADIGERDQQIAALRAAAAERESEVTGLKGELAMQRVAIAERDRRLASMRAAVAHAEEIKNSLAVLLTKRYRRIKDQLFPYSTKRRRIYDGILRQLKQCLAESSTDRFQCLPSIAGSGFEKDNRVILPAVSSDYISTNFHYDYLGDYVPISNPIKGIDQLPVRIIAFYLPQFHPIPENDIWWGKGFTEWTHVTRAKPQFVGHYQPHLPIDLGYYDLRLPEVQERQIELARRYGIYGFCYYRYWFAGRSLLDKPLTQMLLSPHLDFPFCLCWANENWTRRWDGLEQDALITQQHSPEDDLAFIKSIESALNDKRYIRINGKPLLMVYRPSLLPDPKATAERWREYCLKSRLGEIYLVSTQAFCTHDPSDYGFDATVEFPPNNFSVTPITSSVQLLNSEYKGTVWDYRELVAKAKGVERPAYTLFRCVVPSWDNEARRPGRGSSFVHSSPAIYSDWLDMACSFTCNVYSKSERLVFVNAWNEWAEGAHLEPDAKYGYAYLEATAEVLRRRIDSGPTQQKDTAVILHLFYTELWPEFEKYLENLGGEFDLYVSLTNRSGGDPTERILKRYGDAKLYAMRNRGRDIAPFLKILRDIVDRDYKYVCKIHTKLSPHREDGELWRRNLLDKLLGSKEVVDRVKREFDANSSVGIILPKEYLYDHSYFRGSNEATIRELAKRIGGSNTDLGLPFPAGSMFWFRPEALRPLLNLELSADDFPIEYGQVDGTLAHAIERFFPIAAATSGLTISSI